MNNEYLVEETDLTYISDPSPIRSYIEKAFLESDRMKRLALLRVAADAMSRSTITYQQIGFSLPEIHHMANRCRLDNDNRRNMIFSKIVDDVLNTFPK